MNGGTSLRSQLLRWLVIPLGMLWAADAVGIWFSTLETVNAAYDRTLYGAALAISERVTVHRGRPEVDIPPVALEVLDTEDQERLFYRVGYRIGDGPPTLLTGYEELPPPVGAPADLPVFYERDFKGYPVRIAAIETRFPTAPPIAVLVQAAQTLNGRGRLHHSLVFRQIAAQLAVIVLAAGLAWLAVTRGLRPVVELSRDVAARSAADLAPLQEEGVPRELSPMVVAVNDLMTRMRRAIAAQRRFIANASHALRTPLTVLRTEADLALRLEDPRGLREAVVQLRDHSRATSHLASQLLALARVGNRTEATATATFDLGAVARDACAGVVPAALEREVDLGYEGGEPTPIGGREHEVREAIQNLVDNAMRYGRPGGTVTVSVTRSGSREACLAVEDDGPGIPQADRSRVLEPFHRLPGTGGDGAGLGLAIVKEIAQGHGAELRLLDGAGGRGLRVEIRFPLSGREVGP